MSNNPIITLDQVGVAYAGDPVLQGVSLAVGRGDFMAITGPNGGGKTTMLRLMLRLLQPTSGRVAYWDQGQEVPALKFGYLPQKTAIDSRFPVTVEQVVAMGLKLPGMRRLTAAERQLVEGTIALMGLGDVAHHAIGALSGGQLQRTLLGRAIIGNPDVLVLDEPLSYVDKQFEQRLYDIVAQQSRHSTVILVSHELSVISGMANRHIIVENGGITECAHHHHGTPVRCE